MTCLHHVSAHRSGPRGPDVAKRASVPETSVDQSNCCPHQLAARRSTPNTGCLQHAWICFVFVTSPTIRCAMRCPLTRWKRAAEAIWAELATTRAVRPRCGRARTSVIVPSKSKQRHRSMLSWMVFAARCGWRCPQLVLQGQTLKLYQRWPKLVPITATTQLEHGGEIQRSILVMHSVVMKGPLKASLLPREASPMFVGGGGGDCFFVRNGRRCRRRCFEA